MLLSALQRLQIRLNRISPMLLKNELRECIAELEDIDKDLEWIALVLSEPL